MGIMLSGGSLLLSGCAPSSMSGILKRPDGAAANAIASSGAANEISARPMDAFESVRVEDIIKNVYGPYKPINSTDIRLNVPVFAESSEVVPVSVSTSIPGVNSISIIVEGNKVPLIGTFKISANVDPYVSTRLQIEKTTNVIALVKTSSKVYLASADIVIGSKDGCF